ncbi:hypothetical protein ACFSHT_21460 [Paraburkholderia silviterrae]|uniref:Uncharacterized protein n=1 Tax=Paraburkholderia silviterrae TaxID=2528715 RepID=A0A4R5LY29_9BURK|nr:hypothetical protein [Paraburkholderia silviterrae]TDG17199.1 hypothetical protein EYW47_38685 [Paraburkholderia silviterrae]
MIFVNIKFCQIKSLRTQANLIVLSIILSVTCDIATAFTDGANQNTSTSNTTGNCGATIVFPDDFSDGRNMSFPKCSQSYETSDGAVLSLAPNDSSPHGANWLEQIPMLHIRSVGINDLINQNSTGIFMSISRKIKIAPAPTECHLKTTARLSVIAGPNWHGWLIEDSYQIISRISPSPEYCERYSEKNRCIRLAIGNSKVSATMAQYCLTRDPKEFDFDGGLSYDVFYRIIKTIKFTDE